MPSYRIARLVLVCVALLLWGCRSNPTFDTLTNLNPWKSQYANVQPGLEYLLVTLNGKSSVMGLGERTVQGSELNRHVQERWYTGQGEMLYVLDGRIQQALGFTHERRGQTGQAPTWADVLQAAKELPWSRTVDMMPGFRYGVTEHVTTQPIRPPKSLPEGVSPKARWVMDTVGSKVIDGREWWYLQKFAVLDGQVVYSEQCIQQDLCLKLRPLGVLVAAK